MTHQQMSLTVLRDHTLATFMHSINSVQHFVRDVLVIAKSNST